MVSTFSFQKPVHVKFHLAGQVDIKSDASSRRHGANQGHSPCFFDHRGLANSETKFAHGLDEGRENFSAQFLVNALFFIGLVGFQRFFSNT